LNNPVKYTDPTGHLPWAAGVLGLNPAMFAAAVVAVGIYYLAKCAASPSCRATVANAARRGAEAVQTLFDSGEEPKPIPGNPFRGKSAPQRAYDHLERNHGLDPHVAGRRLHNIKDRAGLGATDDVVIGRTGDVYDARTGDRIGSLTDPSEGN
jgi:hypothetical protein